MKVKAYAPANIAFIKYWGKINESLRLPANSSISMNLSNAFTVTSVKFNEKLERDRFILGGLIADQEETDRVSKHVDLIRNIANIKTPALIISKNNFPKASGIASSASGFAALTVAAASAAGLSLSEKDLSVLARLGSGSACRSIPDGIVEWRYGKNSKDSYAHSLYPADYWNISDVIAIVGPGSKKVSSTEGHTSAPSSPFYKSRILGMNQKVIEIKKALKNKDFTRFGTVLEAEAISMHAVMMTSTPPLYYWLPETLEIMQSIINWRDGGLETYFTIDAGPNIHIICQSKDVPRLKKKLSEVKSIKSLIVNRVGRGAHSIK